MTTPAQANDVNNQDNPIGVFDSGIGGLTVVQALMESLPFEQIIYFGDTARVPYGVKSAETITGYARQIDTLVLGCTHYPLLRPLLQKTAGNDVTLIDSATAVAGRAAHLLEEGGLATSLAPPEHRFFVTDAPHRFQQTGESFLGRPLSSLTLVHLQ